MIINSYAIQLTSNHQAQSRVEERVSLSRQNSAEVNQDLEQGQAVSQPNLTSDASLSVELSRRSLNLQQRIGELQDNIENGNRGLANAIDSLFSTEFEDTEDQALDAEIYQLKALVESLIGRDIDLSAITPSFNDDELAASNSTPVQVSTGEISVFEAVQRQIESEVSNFSVQGQVQTTDGQSISIDLSQTLQREFISEVRLSVIAENEELKDPLVINLPNRTLSLTDNRVAFDIDADGQLDNVNFATGGSGFLSLDLNSNGTIDDGSELFGAISGNGFADLAKYDEDGNNFIDAGDSVFTRLQILRKDEQGNDSLTGLQQAGVGALFLGSTRTPFEARDSENQLNALVRSSGFYLTEDGQAGTLQQVDLVV